MSLEDRLYPLLSLYEAAPQPVKSTVGSLYRALPARWRYGEAYARFQSEATASESWDTESCRAYQLQALRETLQTAAQTPFYAERFRVAGVSPESLESLDDLKHFPFTVKDDLLHHREAMVHPGSDPGKRLYLTTGGSSGVPVGFYLEKGISRSKEQAYLEAQWSRRGYASGDRVAVIRGGFQKSWRKGRISTYDATRDWLILSSSHLTAGRIPDYVAALNRFRPRHLHAYPSAALMLARAMRELNLHLDFPLTSLLCGSEKLTAENQAALEAHFGCPVFHWYGHSERVVLAGQGRTQNDLFFWPAYGYVEFSEADDQGTCEIIGTSFHNRVMPLIRYRTGDRVRLAPPAVGTELPFPAVCAVEGREHDFLTGKTGRQVSLTTINMHDRTFDGLLAVQFYQPADGEVELRHVPGPGWTPENETRMMRGVMTKLGNDFTLRPIPVTSVEKTKSGKSIWLLPRGHPSPRSPA